MGSLIRGGVGLIGSHLARHCLKLGQEVVVLDDLSGGFEDSLLSVTLKEGIARMAAWARDKGARKSTLFSGVEVLKNLPCHGDQTLKNMI